MINCLKCGEIKKSKVGNLCTSCNGKIRSKENFGRQEIDINHYAKGSGNNKRRELLIQKQKSRCAICRIKFLDTVRGALIDHNHLDRKIRGALCDNCNKGLGHFKDNVINLGRAYRYLRKTQ